MPNMPSRGKLLDLYIAIPKETAVSRRDVERIVEKLKKEYPQRSFGQSDVGNFLNQNKGFMIPHPEKQGYFLRSDSSLVLESHSKPVTPAKALDLNMSEFSKKLENITQEHKKLIQQINDKRVQKEQLEQELAQDEHKLKELEEALELAREFFRKVA